MDNFLSALPHTWWCLLRRRNEDRGCSCLVLKAKSQSRRQLLILLQLLPLWLTFTREREKERERDSPKERRDVAVVGRFVCVCGREGNSRTVISERNVGQVLNFLQIKHDNGNNERAGGRTAPVWSGWKTRFSSSSVSRDDKRADVVA